MIKNGIFNLFGNFVKLLVMLLSIPVIIYFAGIEEYGLWTLIQAILGLAGLAELGFSMSSTIFISRYLGQSDIVKLSKTITIILTTIITLATLVVILILLFNNIILEIFINLNEIQKIKAQECLIIGSVFVWGNIIQLTLISIEQAFNKYKLMGILLACQAIFNGLGISLLAFTSRDIVYLMYWQSLVTIIFLLLHFLIVVRHIMRANIHFIWDSSLFLEIFRYSLLSWLSSIGSSLFTMGDRMIVGAFLDTRQLGIYSAITTISSKINLFSSLPIQPLLPRLTKFLSEETLDAVIIVREVRRAYRINLILSIGMGLLLVIFSPLIVAIMIPSTNSENIILEFSLAAIIYSLYSLNAVGYYILFASGSITSCVILNLAGSLISLALIALLANEFGLIGAIIGNSGYVITLFFPILGNRRISEILKQNNTEQIQLIGNRR